MAKLSGRNFKELAKVAGIDDGGGRYLFGLRSDGVVLKRRTTEPADASYHRWSSGHTNLTTTAELIELVERSGFAVEGREKRRHAPRPITKADMAPHECWKCRALTEQDPWVSARVFSVIGNDGSDAAKKFIDDYYETEHANHERSWV